jgi:hypothetical protein
MAVSYQVGAPLGTGTLIVDNVTKPGGPYVVIKNTHATESVWLAGDENQDSDETAADLTTATGFVLTAGQSVTLQLRGDERIYARGPITTSTTTIAVFRTNVPL